MFYLDGAAVRVPIPSVLTGTTGQAFPLPLSAPPSVPLAEEAEPIHDDHGQTCIPVWAGLGHYRSDLYGRKLGRVGSLRIKQGAKCQISWNILEVTINFIYYHTGESCIRGIIGKVSKCE